MTQKNTYAITGCAAHNRLSPLLPTNWTDITTHSTQTTPSLLWENAPRHQTKLTRDSVKCYSHLPNGTATLDSKWALARFMRRLPQDDVLATLETHCFRGQSGFGQFWKEQYCSPTTMKSQTDHAKLPDLLDSCETSTSLRYPPNPANLWVIKDANSNGAGGIWVVNEENHDQFLNPQLSPLVEGHRYIAQTYAWPMVLFGGRKCHVRVYGLMTSDGRAFLHNKCFLHVANEPFQTTSMEDSVHITNCCANSHDSDKFAGEIVASLTPTQEIGIVDLSKFYQTMAASLATLAERAFPYLRGGDANGGFEYLGLDFILSERDHEPVAYLLEVNAPPSQDTATGLPHAEELHNSVISDLVHLWVLPRVIGAVPKLGGWKCVYQDPNYFPWDIQPSKAVILNKIRWAIQERKISRELSPDSLVQFIRSQFPFFPSEQIFFENAGGAQVPRQVVERVVDSLKNRNRSVIGNRIKDEARGTLLTLLGTSDESHKVFLGSNATSLLETLASKFEEQLGADDEILLATENHLANVTAWTRLAKRRGSTIKWWRLDGILEELVTDRTRIVAISHASNILGQIRDIHAISKRIKACSPSSIIVVDGVAAAPHVCADLGKNKDVDWYVISCHKLFGPHIGALCGRVDAVQALNRSAEDDYGWFESGTLNYEACSGVVGLGTYFQRLADFENNDATSLEEFADVGALSTEQVASAYHRIHLAENPLVECLHTKLMANPYVRIIEDSSATHRSPVFSFCHKTLQCSEMVESFRNLGIQCRSGTFLSTCRLQDELRFDSVVRLSLAHYNTSGEIDQAMRSLQQLQVGSQLT